MNSEWKQSLDGFSVARLQLEREQRLRSLAHSERNLDRLRDEYHQALVENKGFDYAEGVRADIRFSEAAMTPVQAELEAIENALKTKL